jgi:hypothetical protein
MARWDRAVAVAETRLEEEVELPAEAAETPAVIVVMAAAVATRTAASDEVAAVSFILVRSWMNQQGRIYVKE